MDPIAAGISSDTGRCNELNGALTEFHNAYNAEAYSVLNDGAMVTVGDLFGNRASLDAVLTDGVSGAANSFFAAGLARFSKSR